WRLHHAVKGHVIDHNELRHLCSLQGAWAFWVGIQPSREFSGYVPLYCCELCGWATTGFRVDAVSEHRVECPACSGTMRLVFHLEAPPRDNRPLADLEAKPDRGRERALRVRAGDRGQRRGRPPRVERPSQSPRRNLSW